MLPESAAVVQLGIDSPVLDKALLPFMETFFFYISYRVCIGYSII